MRFVRPRSRALAIGASMVALAASAAGPAAAGTNTWTPLALPTASLQAVGVDPAAAGHVAAATVTSLFATSDGGAAWSRSEPFATSEIVFAPMNPGTVFAVEGNFPGAAIVRSTDGGASWGDWSVVGGDRVTVDPTRANVDYASATGTTTVSRSADDGHSWHQATLDSTVVSNVAVDPTSAQRLLVSTLAGVERSDDGAATWALVSAQISSGTVGSARWMAFAPDGTAYAATAHAGLYSSTDRGATWTHLDNLPTTVADMVVTDPDAPGHLVVYSASDVYASTDGGQSWSTGTGLPPDAVRSVRGISPDLAPGGIVVAATADGIYEGAGSPLVFTKASDQPSGGDVRSLVQAGSDPFTLYAATSGGVYRSDDGGTSWTQHAGGLRTWDTRLVAVDPADPGTALALVHLDGLYRTTDGGDAWTESDSGLGSTDLTAVVFDPSDPQTAYAASASTGVWASGDGGATWSVCAGALATTQITALAVAPTAPTTLYAGDQSGTVESSSDGCATWTPHPAAKLPGAVAAIAVAPSDPGIVYVAGPTGLRRSGDGGESWSPVTGGGATVTVDPLDPDHIWNGLAVSNDAGATWLPLNLPAFGDAGTIIPSPNGGTTLVAGISPYGALTDTLVAPTATTQPATADLDGTGVTLHGSLDGHNADTSYHFEYGPTTAYGSSTPDATTGWNAPPSAPPATLVTVPGQTIHYRLVASSVAGTAHGADRRIVARVPPAITAAPMPSLRTGTIANGRVPVRVVWGGTAGDSSITSWAVDQNTGPTRRRLVLGSPTATSADTTQALAATSYNALHSVTGYPLVQRSGLATAATPIQDGSALLHYRGSWAAVHPPLDWGGSARTTSAAGAAVTATIRARGVAFVTTVGPAFGKARVTIDGVSTVVDLHAGVTAHMRAAFVRNWAATGTHTITITPLTGGAHVDIDALVTLG